jgi:hypothetical protein
MAGPAGRAWRKAEWLCEEAVQADGAAERITAARSWLSPDGTLQTREEAQPQLREASAQLPGPQWSKGRRLLREEWTLRPWDRMHEPRAAVVSVPLWRESLTRWWYFSDAMRQAQGEDGHRFTHLVAMEQVLCQRLCAQGQAAYVGVDTLWRPAVRASRAGEGGSSVVRMHQGRHRHVSQGMLDLKRLYWNCRVFRDGKRKGRCPYDLLGLKVPIADEWQLLQMNPEELAQKPLTQDVRA